MKKRMNLKRAALYCAAMLLTGLLAVSASAQQSFSATNTIANGVLYAGDPTNAPGLSTGGAINVQNYSSIGIYISGTNANSSASAITALLEVSGSSAPPVAYSTNRTWETTPSITISATSPAAAGPWYYFTNVTVGSARWIGIRSVTNGTASASLGNAVIGVTKKIVPTSLTGGNF